MIIIKSSAITTSKQSDYSCNFTERSKKKIIIIINKEFELYFYSLARAQVINNVVINENNRRLSMTAGVLNECSVYFEGIIPSPTYLKP